MKGPAMYETTPAHSLALQLRERTAQHHKNAEGRALEQSLAQGKLPLVLYLGMLSQRYLVHRTLEKHLGSLKSTAPTVAPLVDPVQFLTPHAESDLRHFGVSTDVLTPLKATQRLCSLINETAARNPAALVGMHYVFEGSKNGSRYLCRVVRQAYRLPDAEGTRYMDPHGDQQRPLWERFKQQLDQLPVNESQASDIVSAACAMFDGIGAIDDELMSNAPSLPAGAGHAHAN